MADSPRWAEEAHRRATTPSFSSPLAQKEWEEARAADDKRTSQNLRIRCRLERVA